MKSCFLMMLFVLAFQSVDAQKYFTREGNISFHSDAPMEKIEAFNQKATSVFDLESGQIEWAVLIKAFKFEKALMEEHFNENYMESSKHPKAKFKGKLGNLDQLDLSKDGMYELPVSGSLEIHGVSNEVSTTAKFEVKEGNIIGNSELTVLVADYGIEIPAVVRDNIAKEVLIKIEANYKALE